MPNNMPIDEQIEDGQNAVIKYIRSIFNLGILYVNLIHHKIMISYLSLGFCGKINTLITCQAINIAFYFLICNFARQYYINNYYQTTMFSNEPQSLVQCFSECLNPSIEHFSNIFQNYRKITDTVIENWRDNLQEKIAELPDHHTLYLAWREEQ